MYLRTGLGLSSARSTANNRKNIIKSYNFSAMTSLPAELNNTRSGPAWYQDKNGLIHKETLSNTLRFGTVYGSAAGGLVEIQVTAENHYARPYLNTVNEHFNTGAAIASIGTDNLSPCQNLTNGNAIWILDNSGGSNAIDVEWNGAITSGKASAMAYLKTVSGLPAMLSINGNGTEETGHTVLGYTLHKCEDRTVSGSEHLRISVPAGSIIHVACVNLQAYDVITSFIDTEGKAVTRNGDDLNGSDISWWSGLQQGCFYLDFTHLDDNGESAHIFEIRNTALSERFTIWHTSGLFYTTIRSGNINVVQQAQPGLNNDERVRLAISYQDNQFTQAINGFTVYDITTGNAPDTTSIASSPNPLSFLSVNRSGANPLNGIIHSFILYDQPFSQKEIEALTSPNTNNELWIAIIGDSNLERWNISWGGRPQERFNSTIQSYMPDAIITNEGKSGSTANYNAAQLLGADWWSGINDIGGGNIHSEALARNKNLTKNELRQFDYMIINLGANDLRRVTNGDITIADYKTSFQNVINTLKADYGEQVKFIMQYLPNTDHPDYTDQDMQDMRIAMKELVDENTSIIASYDTYDTTRVDYIHADEDGYNTLTDRAANIILSDLGYVERLSGPYIQSAKYNGNSIIIETDTNTLSGNDTSIFRVESDSLNVTVNTALISGNIITLVLDAPIMPGSTVKLWVSYGQMSSINSANCIRNTETGYPLQFLGAYTVREA